MKTWIATTAALALLAGIASANAETPPTKSDKTMEQSTAPKAKTTRHKRMHQSMRMKRGTPRETTGFGGRIGSGVNDPSIHQSHGDRDSRGFPKQH